MDFFAYYWQSNIFTEFAAADEKARKTSVSNVAAYFAKSKKLAIKVGYCSKLGVV